MGTSGSPAQLAVKLAVAGGAVANVPREVVFQSALLVKGSVMGFAPARLRNVGKRGAKLGVRFTVTGTEGGASARVQATGPFQIIENNTKPHVIPKARSRGKQRVVVIPGVGVRAYAHHPGTKGKHPWANGIDAALPLMPRAQQAAAVTTLKAIF